MKEIGLSFDQFNYLGWNIMYYYPEKTLEQKQIRDYWQLLATALIVSVFVSNNVFSFMHKLERTTHDAIRIVQQ